MDEKLRILLDYQCFQSNKRLATLIADVESRYGGALADDDLSLVSAAGEAALPSTPQEGTEDDK